GAPSIATHERSVADPACHSLPAPSPGIALGPEVPAESFEFADIVDEAPTGRLQRKLLVTPDGVTEPLSLYDTVVQERCDLIPSDDGTWRCLPLYHQWGVAYTDANCTAPIMVVEPGAICPGDAFPRYATDVDPNACPSRILVYEVEAKVDPPAALYQYGFGRTCAAIDPPAAGASTYAVAKRAPDDFELVTLRP